MATLTQRLERKLVEQEQQLAKAKQHHRRLADHEKAISEWIALLDSFLTPPVMSWCGGCDRVTLESEMSWVAHGSRWRCRRCVELIAP